MADDWDDDDMDDLFFLMMNEQEEARRRGGSDGGGCLGVLLGFGAMITLALAGGAMLL